MQVRILGFLVVSLLLCTDLLLVHGGVSKEIAASYVQRFENRALYLMVPLRGDQQTVLVGDRSIRRDRSTQGLPLTFRVGEHVRITKVDFKDQFVRFDLTSTDLSRQSSLFFRFTTSLTYSFPQKEVFDKALESTLTEGLSYREVDQAKARFVKDEYTEMVREVAAATETSPEFVGQAVAAMNPTYQEAIEQSTLSQEQAAQLQTELQEARQERDSLHQEIRGMRTQLQESGDSARVYREQNQELTKQLADLQRERADLEGRNQGFQIQIENLEGQINQLARQLNTESASKTELGDRLEDLTESIGSLQTERTSLSGKLAQVSSQLKQLSEENRLLSSELEDTRRNNTKLQRDLGAITRNREGLEARFLRLQEERDKLAMADALAASLRFLKRLEENQEGLFQVSDIYLLSHKIGTLEVQVPHHPERVYVVRLRLDSPDTVEFSEEERRLYDALGSPVRVSMKWEPWTDLTEAVLTKGEVLQEIEPREEAEWRWLFRTALEGPERLSFSVTVQDVNGYDISLPAQEFRMTQASFLPSLSLTSMLFGAISALVLVGVFAWRRRSASRKRQPRSEAYPVQKQL